MCQLSWTSTALLHKRLPWTSKLLPGPNTSTLNIIMSKMLSRKGLLSCTMWYQLKTGRHVDKNIGTQNVEALNSNNRFTLRLNMASRISRFKFLWPNCVALRCDLRVHMYSFGVLSHFHRLTVLLFLCLFLYILCDITFPAMFVDVLLLSFLLLF